MTLYLSCSFERAGLSDDSADPVEIPTALLHTGDVVKVMPGARVPCDGEVVSGTSHADESMITGESRPVTKGVGSTVIGGSVNTTGSLAVRATCVGSNSMLNQIVKLVAEAQSSKAPIEAFADKVSSRFVPAVVSEPPLLILSPMFNSLVSRALHVTIGLYLQIVVLLLLFIFFCCCYYLVLLFCV